MYDYNTPQARIELDLRKPHVSFTSTHTASGYRIGISHSPL